MSRQFKQKGIITIMFIILSAGATIMVMKDGVINGIASDAGFHFSRVEQIYDNLKNGSFFTFIATNTFHQTGAGSFLFYPTVFLYPWAFLRFFLDPVSSFYCWYGIMTFLCLMISYFSMKSFSKETSRSAFFALLYTFGLYRLRLGIVNLVLGEFVAYTFLPLAFVGFYHVFWGDSRKWYDLAIGVALIGYSHFLSLYLTVLIFIAILICNIIIKNNLSKERLLSLVKSIITAILLMGYVLVPFLTDYLGKNLKVPAKGAWFVNTINDLISSSLANGPFAAYNIGFFLIVGALIGWYFVKNNNLELSIYISGILILLMSTSFFPWEGVKKTFLGTIQFPYRLHSYGSLLIAVTTSFILVKILKKKPKRTRMLTYVAFLIIFGISYSGVIQTVNSKERINSAQYLAPNKDGSVQPLDTHNLYKVDKRNYHNIFQYSVTFGESDYYPKKSVNGKNTPEYIGKEGGIWQKVAFINNKKKNVIPVGTPNNLTYFIKTSKSGSIDLPVVAYSNTYAFINGSRTNYLISKRGTVSVQVKPGNNRITVGYKPSMAFYFFVVVAIATWVCLFLSWIYRLNKHTRQQVIQKE